MSVGPQRHKLLAQMLFVVLGQRHEVHHLPREHVEQHPRIAAQSAQAGVENIEGFGHGFAVLFVMQIYAFTIKEVMIQSISRPT